jgi:hypothetical protein
MEYAKGQRLAGECLPGTREKILEEITEWINCPSPSSEEHVPCVYWLHGVAGCGKSAIASTIAKRFENVKRCAWYFFDASKQSGSGPEQMFSTLSRTLADMDAKWRESLVRIVKPSRRLQTTVNVKEQFENFILEPAKTFEPMGPILIVIDALDESGSRQDRVQLLGMLSRLDELGHSGHFRFLITSRPEEDISSALANRTWVHSTDLTTIDEISTDDDIRRYVDKELSHIPALMRKWPEKPWLNLIVTRAEHLFQWAFVACAFIGGVGQPGADHVKRFIRLQDHFKDVRLGKLDQLYKTVLRDLYSNGLEEDEDRIPQFRKVLGRILCARQPLSLDALTKLREEEGDEEEIERVVCCLGSLLKGVDRKQRHEPIQPLHASFIDFLSDRERSGEFYVKKEPEDAVLARSSLRVMNELLRFNICKLESSYIRDRDLDDLQTRVKENIPEHLAYACRYFADHVSSCIESHEMLKSTHELLRKKLLFWLEALSLLKNTSQALTQLLTMQTWIKVWTDDTHLEETLTMNVIGKDPG